MTRKILIVDDEKNMREFLKDLFELEGYEARGAADGETALADAGKEPPDLMILDLRLPGIQGMEVLRRLRAGGAAFPIIIITAHGDVAAAVDAVKAGAADFIVKPFDNGRVVAAVKQALEAEGFVAEAGLSRPVLDNRKIPGAPEIIGHSPEILGVFETIEKVAATHATVLIRGESGTGKELVAQALHMRSTRRDGPMICLNCAALPETLLESELFGYERGAFTGAHRRKSGKMDLADGGTLFLDEVGDLSASAQAKLLRVLEEREFCPLGGDRSKKVDIRIIAATNRDLESMSRSGSFRDDLFFRLNVVPLYLPPLRERTQDIAALASHFLAKYKKRHGREDAALADKDVARMSAYSWPGNIRELEHAIEKFVILGDLPIPEASGAPLPLGAARGGEGPVGPLKDAVKAAEREIIIRALRRAGGNKSQAARDLKISYKTLFNKISEHGIEIKSEIE